jgi:putative transposase
MSVAVLLAYRVALDPTRARDLERHAGAARFAYNWALATVRANIDQRAAERPYGLGGEDLTPVLGWNLPAPRRAGNQVNDQVAPWWTECSG